MMGVRMKKTGFSFFLILVAFFYSLSYADDRWLNYHEGYFYNASSVKCNNNICNVWVKLITSEIIELKPRVYVKDTTYFLQLNCQNKLITNSLFVIQNMTDGSSEKKQYKKDWIPIVEERDRKLLSIVCSGVLESSQKI